MLEIGVHNTVVRPQTVSKRDPYRLKEQAGRTEIEEHRLAYIINTLGSITSQLRRTRHAKIPA